MEGTRQSGKLQLIIGPMFSGKSTELIRRVTRYKLRNSRCLMINHKRDDRYGKDQVATHDGKKIPANCTLNLLELKDSALNYDVIGIDEAHFFPDLVEFCKELLENKKIIIVSGLDATYKRTGFDNVLNLVPLAHSVDKLSAVCMSCGGNASFSKRVSSEDEVVVIGGLEKYMAVCRECYKLTHPPRNSPFKGVQDGRQLALPESDLAWDKSSRNASTKNIKDESTSR